MALPRPDPERTRRIVGLVIYIVMMLAGAGALVFFFLVLPLEAPNPEGQVADGGTRSVCLSELRGVDGKGCHARSGIFPIEFATPTAMLG